MGWATPSLRLPGWPPLAYDREGSPTTIQWLSVEPDGELSVWTSDNVMGYSPHHDIWIQWALLQDVYRLICPPGHRHIRDVQAIHTTQGTILSPRRRGDDHALWPTNLPASAMVEALPDTTSKTYGETPLYGTVAWLGELAPTGLHVDLSEVRIEELVGLRGRWAG